jgi:flavin reductase (DIM6/NTAB) family NADH-FMN oxidoreductase RutF
MIRSHPVTVLARPPGTFAPAEALGQLVRAVCVVSARHDAAVHAMTVDSLAALSADPARVVLGVRPDSRWWELASDAGRFATSVLAAGQEDLARWFASRSRGESEEQFEAVAWRPGTTTRAPLLAGAAAWFECRVEGSTRAGDQVIVIAHLTGEAGRTPALPALLRVDRAYRSLP